MKKHTLTLETNSHQETQALAFKLGNILDKGVLITLEGELAAGKTTFTQGLAKGLGVKAIVNSPTFVIMKEYEGRLPLIHIDAYRLEGITQDLGFEDYLDNQHVIMIEWSDYLPSLNSYDRQHIKIQTLENARRHITLHFDSDLIEKLKQLL